MYEPAMIIRNRLSVDMDEMDLFKIADLYEKNVTDHFDDEGLKKYFVWDLELLRCPSRVQIIGGYKGKRLVSTSRDFKGIMHGMTDTIETDRIDFYKTCLQSSSNIAVRIRYLD